MPPVPEFAGHTKTLPRISRPEPSEIADRARTHLKFEPDEAQAHVLRSETKRGILFRVPDLAPAQIRLDLRNL
jgi:hypothetical protein